MVAVSLPGGLVTFLFTDIEGSTAMWESHPRSMAWALERHDDVLSRVIARHEGHVFSRAGDAFAAAFEDPASAAGAALQAQHLLAAEAWPEPIVIRVRMGMHTGTAQVRGGDYFGPTLNRAARIAGTARGGQIMVSAATAELIRRHLPSPAHLAEVGEFRLRGLVDVERVFQLNDEELDSLLPAPRADRAAGNLPRYSTVYVGRAAELAEVVELAGSERLVTLVGPGGVGKTRLAVELASELARMQGGEVFFCALAPVHTGEAALNVIAGAVGARLEQDRDPIAAITDAVATRRSLIVLDNCEHVLESTGAVSAALLAASGATVLATSRQPLDLAGERVWLVKGLDAADSAVLFAARARAANREFEISADDETVGELCRRLEGLPLAIELAAARSRSMTPTEISARLDSTVEFLHHAGGGLDERHRSLRATLEWSLDLLSSMERDLFVRLAIFAGTFDLAAVREVCGNATEDAVVDQLDVMVSLVDKSLVVADLRGTTARYRLLEPLRQYGVEILGERDEFVELTERHAEHYTRTAERVRDWYEGTENERGRAGFVADWDNFRVALNQSVETGATRRVGRLLDAAYHYAAFSYRTEYAEWAEHAMTMPEPPPEAYAASGYWRLSTDPIHSIELAHQGLRAREGQPDADDALCWFLRAATHYYTGDVDAAWTEVMHYQRTRELRGGPFRVSHAAGIAATIATLADPAAAPGHARRAMRIAGPLHNDTLDAWLAHIAALAATAIGDHGGARELYRAAVARGDGDVNPLAYTQALLSLAMRAPPNERAGAYREAIERLHAAGNATDIWVLIESLAAHWATAGLIEPAAVLLGHLGTHTYRFAATEPRRRRALASIQVHPDSADWMAAGADLHASELIDYTLRSLDEQP
jgi:predicted ATPase/class 3 adenylate cyclase